MSALFPENACHQDYSRHLEEFLVMSGASASARMGNTDDWVRPRFDLIHQQMTACTHSGCRYWEVQLQMVRYARSVLGNASWCPHCQDRDLFHTRAGLLSELLYGGMCFPASCSYDEVEAATPLWLGFIHGVGSALPPPSPAHVKALELSQWARLPLDFVIAGVANCGTTSLYRNLDKHPDIAFSSQREDSFFFQHDNLLPYSSEVHELGAVWAAHYKRSRIRGLRHPALWQSSRLRHAFARASNIRVIAIVCDPLSRIEKLFHAFHLCRAEFTPPAGCWHSFASFLESPTELSQFLARWQMESHLKSLVRLFSPQRLRVIHQESLREAPAITYSGLASFLGVSAFPPGIEFHRYNSLRGHRSDLCRNASLVQVLQRHLESEYEALHDGLVTAGVAVPIALQLRRSRCDRPEELHE